jgi:hypothetical protein
MISHGMYEEIPVLRNCKINYMTRVCVCLCISDKGHNSHFHIVAADIVNQEICPG